MCTKNRTCVSLRVLRRHLPRSVTLSEWLRKQDWSTRERRTQLDLQRRFQSVFVGVSESHASRKGGHQHVSKTRSDVQTGGWNDDVCIPRRVSVPKRCTNVVEHQRTPRCVNCSNEAFATDRRLATSPKGQTVVGTCPMHRLVDASDNLNPSQ